MADRRAAQFVDAACSTVGFEAASCRGVAAAFVLASARECLTASAGEDSAIRFALIGKKLQANAVKAAGTSDRSAFFLGAVAPIIASAIQVVAAEVGTEVLSGPVAESITDPYFTPALSGAVAVGDLA